MKEFEFQVAELPDFENALRKSWKLQISYCTELLYIKPNSDTGRPAEVRPLSQCGRPRNKPEGRAASPNAASIQTHTHTHTHTYTHTHTHTPLASPLQSSSTSSSWCWRAESSHVLRRAGSSLCPARWKLARRAESSLKAFHYDAKHRQGASEGSH